MASAGWKRRVRAGRSRAALLALWLAAPLVAAEASADGVPQRDWKNLSARELTFIPEAEKKPALDHFLAGETWEFEYAESSKEWCRRILDRVLAWRDVEILEPDIRTNEFDDSKLDFLRESCPDLRPEAVDEDRDIVGTHGFRVFFVDKSEQGQLLIFGRVGANTPERIKEEGYEPENGNPRYYVVDTKSCMKWSLSDNIWRNFSFYIEGNHSFGDALILKIKGDIIWLRFVDRGDWVPHLAGKSIEISKLQRNPNEERNICSFR